MITIKDIAREAAVSPTTVSRVINNIPNKVSKEKSDQIKLLIEKYHFMPNPSARSLTANESNIIAVLLREQCLDIQTGFYNKLLQSLIYQIQGHGYLPTIYYVDSIDTLEMLKKFNIDGAALLGNFDDFAEELTQQDYPVVFIDSYPAIRLCSNVGTDDYKAGMLAAQKLSAHECTMFMYVRSESLSLVQQQKRLEGFQDTLEKSCLPLAIETSMSDIMNDESSITDKTGFFIQSAKDAFFLSTIVKDPERLVCFDYVSSSYPTVFTVISQDVDKKAQSVIDILLKQIQSTDGITQHLIFDIF